MRIRYTGAQATEHRGTGVWAPGEAREVEDGAGAALVAAGAFVELPDAAGGIVLGGGNAAVSGRSETVTVEPQQHKRGRKAREE